MSVSVAITRCPLDGFSPCREGACILYISEAASAAMGFEPNDVRTTYVCGLQHIVIGARAAVIAAEAAEVALTGLPDDEGTERDGMPLHLSRIMRKLSAMDKRLAAIEACI